MGTQTFSASLNLSVTPAYVSTFADGSIARDGLAFQFVDALASGTAADQADRMWHDKRTLAATTSETLDIVGSLSDVFGTSFAPARIKMIIIQNTSTTAGAVLNVGAAGSNPWTGWTSVTGSTVNVGPGGLWISYDPSATAMVATGGTADQLKVNNGSSGSITYQIIIIGASA